ncbi:protein-tyrosine phosphatase [Fistulifera solaris]|uniref:protein-tyrosine-phosphatase n=1 Tax=Fistulifera solaris TaxID=1519565 RepID=A0A1Z5KHD7_FISSO|nr:protein-tyrosine phosphatase [Fistulifera solaris]|eukprot:GAX25740.1 protein-tyrosine phosphatase [Fistulifera solaris]
MGTEHLEQPVNVQAISRPGASINNSAKKQKGNGVMMANAMTIGTEPTFIEVKQMRFLIMDAPRQGNLHLYIKKLRKHHVTDIVRYCEPTYKSEELTNAGIRLHEMEFKDGTSPSKEIIMAWLQLVDKTFFQGAGDNACIAVHCVAGLGRAPQMVAIALIEFGGMDPVEAVSYIRERRRGAINEKQLLYLEGYRKQYKRAGGAEGGCCVIL